MSIFLDREDMTPRARDFHDLLVMQMRESVKPAAVYAEAVADRLKAKWSVDLKQSTTRQRCPHFLLGKKPADCSGVPCSCFGALGFDHVAMWTRNGYPYAISAQPYHLRGEVLKNLAHLETLGLQVRVTADSYHYPGRALMVVIHKKD